MFERTLAIIKPGACNRREAGEIFSDIEAAMGFDIVRAKYFRMDLDTAHEFYKEHAGKPYYAGLIEHTTSGPCMAIELHGNDVIKRWRDWIGPTDPMKGGVDGLRYQYGTGVPDNGLHGSDSVESAKREIALVFGDHVKMPGFAQAILDAEMFPSYLEPCPPTCGLGIPLKPEFQTLLGKFFGSHPDLPEPVTPTIQFKRIEGALGLGAILPLRAKQGDSGMDLFCAERKLIRKGSTAKVTTGWKIELPPGIEGQVRPRSGMSSKGVRASFGTVDAGYRGELLVTLYNSTSEDYWVTEGDKIAQLVPAPVLEIACCETVGPLSESERGEAGFGSTGK